MLTTELLRVRRQKGVVVPRYLRKKAAERAVELAESYLEVLGRSRGESRAEIESRLSAIPASASERVLAAGLRKLLEDRSTYEVQSPLEPAAVRRALFRAAAGRHRAMGIGERFDDAVRGEVLASVAAELGASPEELEASLYADLQGEERLSGFRPIGPQALVDRYNLALAQAVLVRATRVVVEVRGGSPQRYRRLFRAVRFHGLLHVVTRLPDGYRIELDGPFSLFDSVQRYGLRLALFLPSLLACENFNLRAELVWGRTRERLSFELSPADGLSPDPEGDPAASPPVDLEAFTSAFEALGSRWAVRQSDAIFALPGEVVCVPDLAFSCRETGEEVFLEVFGFWSREAVFRRVDLVRRGLPGRIILAVPKSLRVSAEVLDEGEAGEILLFRSTLSPRVVLERLERAASVGAAPSGP